MTLCLDNSLNAILSDLGPEKYFPDGGGLTKLGVQNFRGNIVTFESD